jgi:hypothetical protein
MALNLSVNLEAYPQGTPLGIVGLGVVENGGILEVSPESEPVYFAVNGYTVEDGTKDQEGMDVSGSAEWTPPVEDAPQTQQESAPPPPPDTTTPPPDTPPEGGV